MKDGFEATLVVELAPDEVWEALTRRTLERDTDAEGQVHYVLPGFPSFPPLSMVGASCSPLEAEPGRLLRVRKDDEPCSGTEIAVTLEKADTGTRVTVVQSGFGPWLERLRDTFETHWLQIVADFRLYLERGLTVVPTAFGANLGALTRHTPVGLEVMSVDAGGFAQNAGLAPGDLLLTVGGIRIHDTQQLWTVLALCEADRKTEVTWARGRDAMQGRATAQAPAAPG